MLRSAWESSRGNREHKYQRKCAGPRARNVHGAAWQQLKTFCIAPISSKDAAALVRRVHYSGKVVPNSQLHLGVFLWGRLEGAMQPGPSMDKPERFQGLVEGTKWNGFLELNRMAFSDRLPRTAKAAHWAWLCG